MGGAGVERHERPVAELERHRLDLQRREVDPDRVAGLAAQRRELVEQAGLGADPVVLHARAQLGQLAPVGRLGLARDGEQREAQRGLQRGRARRGPSRARGRPRSSAGTAAARSRRPSARRRCRARTRASPRLRSGAASAKLVLLAEVERVGLDAVAASGSAVTVTPRAIANGSARPAL